MRTASTGGSSSSGIGGSCSRVGPNTGDGETRWPHTGSTSTRCAVDLEQRAGVPEPGDRELGGLGGQLRRRQRDRAAGQADVPLLVPLPQQAVAGVGRGQRGGLERVVELAVGEVRRAGDDRAAAGGGARRGRRAGPRRRGSPSRRVRRGRRRSGRRGGAGAGRHGPVSQPKLRSPVAIRPNVTPARSRTTAGCGPGGDEVRRRREAGWSNAVVVRGEGRVDPGRSRHRRDRSGPARR